MLLLKPFLKRSFPLSSCLLLAQCGFTHIMEKTMHRWTPCEHLFQDYKDQNYAVLVLNTPINFVHNNRAIVDLWNSARVRLTVDGGTNQWFNWLENIQVNLDSVALPDLVTGDMDSLSEDLLEFIQKKHPGVKVVKTPDQNYTDYAKALGVLQEYCTSKKKQIDSIFVLVDSCGRFDQIMANINTLFKSQDLVDQTKIFQVSSTSITWLLRQGQHSISIPEKLRKGQEWCALIPVGSTRIISTKGLKWNVDNQITEFGGMISSSNTYEQGSSQVIVETDGPIIWSMGIARL